MRQGEAPKSTLWAPLIVGGEATGVVSVQNLDREQPFSHADVRCSQTLAASLSVSLETARLIAETSRRADEMSALADMAAEISATLDVAGVLDRIVERVLDLLEVETCAVYLAEPDGRSFKALVPRARRLEILDDTILRGRGDHRQRRIRSPGRVRQRRERGPAHGPDPRDPGRPARRSG